MVETLVLILTLFVFIIASYEDIKKKEIYDYINFSYAFFILIIALVDSFLSYSLDPIKFVGFGLLIGFALGAMLYYFGVWGGGDAKFLIGFSASTYYLINFTNEYLPSFFYSFIIEKTTFILSQLILILSNYLIIINIIAISGIIVFSFKKRDILIIKNSLYQFLILALFTFGLYFEISSFYLFLWGFTAFLLIFFGDDYLFYSFYLVLKKRISKLKESDILDKDLKLKNLNLSYEKVKFGLSKEDISDLKNSKSNAKVPVRLIIPISTLVTLNFILYIFKILSIEKLNLDILSFQLKFLLISFLIGGILAILIMSYYALRNLDELKNLFNSYEKLIFFGLIFSLLLGFIFNIKFMAVLLFGLIYYFLKSAKKLEKLIFYKKKKLKNIVLGDWISQDIKIGNKVYFTIDDFKLGVDEIQLEKIKELGKKHKSLSTLIVKDGIAFLPPLFIGFLILLLI